MNRIIIAVTAMLASAPVVADNCGCCCPVEEPTIEVVEKPVLNADDFNVRNECDKVVLLGDNTGGSFISWDNSDGCQPVATLVVEDDDPGK